MIGIADAPVQPITAEWPIRWKSPRRVQEALCFEEHTTAEQRWIAG
jgi:hypothetical protein